MVLLLVLMVVAVCGTVLAAATRRSGQSAVQANSALRELQFRWGAVSCWSAARPLADRLLDEGRTMGAPASCEARRTVVLGGMTFHLTVGDESAKANVNWLWQRHEDAGLAIILGRLQADTRQPLRVELRPQVEAPDGGVAAERYVSFDQVFVLRGPADLVGAPRGPTAAACRRLTFWGPGQVNLRRADLAVLREVFAGLLTESHLAALDKLRREQPDLAPTEALARLQLTKEQSDQVMPLVSDSVECFSLWVVAELQPRSWYRLFVQMGEDGPDAQRWTLAW
jgi:hypothetical protein